jgi:hypothetical protein
MRELLVEAIISLARSHPYLLGAAALIGFFWLARSGIHKARLFTEHLTLQVRGGKGELREWFVAAKDLKRELTSWRAE